MTDPNNYGVVIEAGTLEGCKTIDDSKNENNNYLKCARTSYPAAAKHDTTKLATDNLFVCTDSTSPSVNIVGHGMNGVINTGNGSRFFNGPHDPLKQVAHDNKSDWETHFQRLTNKVKNLYLLGCQTGAGKEGATLLFEMAKIINAPVAAPTGEIYSNCRTLEFTLENGATWQVADPNKEKPEPINPPEPVITQKVTSLNLFLVNRFVLVKPVSISEKIKYPEKEFAGDSKDLTEPEFNLLLQSVDFMKPIILPGAPSAMRTGCLSFSTRAQDRRVTKRFYVLNNRMLQDKDFPYIAYYCSKEIKQLFG